jgi:cytochrome c-type biogenesis protein
MLNSVGFILGFSIVFSALGAISTEVGRLAQYKSTLARLAGVVIVIFGFHRTGIFGSMFSAAVKRERRL